MSAFWKIIPLLVVLTYSCKSDSEKKDIRHYYFPLKQITEGLVYEYMPISQDSLSPAYWYYRSFFDENGAYMTGTYYEYDFIPLQFVREEVVGNGMLLEDIKIYYTDSTGVQESLPIEILSGSVFPFEVRDSGGIFLYKIRWSQPDNPSVTTTLIKNRRYVGDTTYTYKGKNYDCVAFEVRELIELEDEAQGGMEPEWDGLELYAKDLGLVYYRKRISEQLDLSYGLKDTYPMEELEAKFKEYLEQ